MTRKKGIYEIVYFQTKNTPETVVTGINWKQVQDKLTADYKEFINVKDLEHTTEPFFKVVTSAATVTEKNLEEYFYTKKK